MFKLRIYQPPSTEVEVRITDGKVLETFKGYPEGLTDEELSSLLNIKEATARWARYRLQRRGLIQELPSTRTIHRNQPRKLFALVKKSKRFPTGA